MEKLIDEKWESLKKYLPYIDYVISTKDSFYTKFRDIKEWMIQKKSFPLDNLDEIEKRIKQHYQKAITADKKLPKEISKVFYHQLKVEYCNLCSDEEEDPKENSSNCKGDSDDDIEIVSVSHVQKPSHKPASATLKTEPLAKCSKESTSTTPPPPPKSFQHIDDETERMLKKIDEIEMETLAKRSYDNFEPNNYHIILSDEEEEELKETQLFQRRQRKDDTEIAKKSEGMNEGSKSKGPQNNPSIVDAVSLDSSDDETVTSTKHESNDKSRTEHTISTSVRDYGKVQIENLSSDEMYSYIRETVSNLELAKLKELCKYMAAVSSSDALPSPASSIELNKHSREESPPPPPPTASYDNSVSNDNAEKAWLEVFGQYFQRKPIQPAESNTQPTIAVLPQQTPINTFNNPGISTSTHSMSHPLYRRQVPPSNPQPNFCAQAVFNSRDPRARSALYQNSFAIIQNEMAKRKENSTLPSANVIGVTAATTSQSNAELTRPVEQPKNFHQLVVEKRRNDQLLIKEAEYKRQRILEENRRKETLLREAEQTKQEQAEQCKQQQAEQCKQQQALKADSCKENIPNRDDRKTKPMKEQCEDDKLIQKSEEEKLELLYSTLEPYKEKIFAKWKPKNVSAVDAEMSEKKTEDSLKKDQESGKRIENRINKLVKEMQCTFKDFEKFTNASGSKRRSSLHARSAISEQLSISHDEINESDNRNQNSKDKRRLSLHATQISLSAEGVTEVRGSVSLRSSPVEEPPILYYPTPPVRHSSIHARSVIAGQLNSQSSLDWEENSLPSTDANSSLSSRKISATKNLKAKKRPSAASLLSESEPKKFKAFVPDRVRQLMDNIIAKQLRVMVRRLTATKTRKLIAPKKSNANILNVHLVQSGIRPETKNDQKSLSTFKKLSLKKYNNDCHMTEQNTTLCPLCGSKPSNVTNHFIQKHKCESYVSRLSWSDLDELCINTPFAKLESSSSSSIRMYTVLCPFCKLNIKMSFLKLFNHYASHTGEYAFQCSKCHKCKPFKTEIQLHQSNSVRCRNSPINILYRYPPNTLSIYLHYCTICNFVQLNEANILKHLREHHCQPVAKAENVQKCILAAISDEPDTNSTETTSTHSMKTNNQDIEVNDVLNSVQTAETPVITESEIILPFEDNIPVFNEANLEETFSLEERLEQIHGGHTTDVPTLNQQQGDKIMVSFNVSHFPGFNNHATKLVKSEEAIDFEENSVQMPLKPFSVSNKSRSKNVCYYKNYRQYPPNVNYLGFYKCMFDDCFYSSDAAAEFVKHLEGHSQYNESENNLHCPYCIIPPASSQSVQFLLDHYQTQHVHLVYQCSICCYRSCEASNVLIHQKENHPLEIDVSKIYKGIGDESIVDLSYIRENMSESVKKIQCPDCTKSYYNTFCLMQHIKFDHQKDVNVPIQRYSCVYCHFWDTELSVIRTHMALNHPGEIPYACDHNALAVTEDSLGILEPKSLAEIVSFLEVGCTYDTMPAEVITDIKPNVKELLNCQVEKVKKLLRKLTEKSGVAPDYLYQCPESSCSGFFSLYNLWIRHMRVKHSFRVCKCPHCPVMTVRALEEFQNHFEEHRRHTYICLHCRLTALNVQQAEDHWAKDHIDLGPMNLEQIRFNVRYSYYIITKENQFPNQQEMLSSLYNIVDRRIKELETCQLKNKWLVSDTAATAWLEDYAKNAQITITTNKKCFQPNCNFITRSEDEHLKHVCSNHETHGVTFECSTCDFRLEPVLSLDDVYNHMKLHSETGFFICGACSSYYRCRSKISEHIKKEHSARDVPVVNLIKKRHLLYANIAIVFANGCVTFTSMRNCFCCEDRNLNGSTFLLHLRQYHKLVLNYFCEWCHKPIDSLLSVENHFKEYHTTNKLKIRCEISSKKNLSIPSLNALKLRISETGSETQTSICVKEEPLDVDNDGSMMILDDEDILVQNFENKQLAKAEKSGKPNLKCIAMENLTDHNKVKQSSSHGISVLPASSLMNICENRNSERSPCNVPNSNSNMLQTDTVISRQRIVLPPYYLMSASNVPNNSSTNIMYTPNILPNAYFPPNYSLVRPNEYQRIPPAGLSIQHPTAVPRDGYVMNVVPHPLMPSYTINPLNRNEQINTQVTRNPILTSFLNSPTMPAQDQQNNNFTT